MDYQSEVDALKAKCVLFDEKLSRVEKTLQDSREEVASAKSWRERFANLILSKIEQNGKEDIIRLDILYKLIWQMD